MLTIRINPEILHLVGPLSIHIYGFFVALGVGSFIGLTFNSAQRKKYISSSLYEKLLFFTIIISIIGARLVHIASEWQTYSSLQEALSIWNGGLSILGAVVAGLIGVPIFLRFHNIQIFPILDMAAVYLPLAQAIARLGCLFAGCCFGCTTDVAWAISYTHTNSHAPLNVLLHPTQLYSSLFFLALFIIMRIGASHLMAKKGRLTALYLIFSSLERFVIDFFRGDRIINNTDSLIFTSYLSLHQWISLIIIATTLAIMFFSRKIETKKH